MDVQYRRATRAVVGHLGAHVVHAGQYLASEHQQLFTGGGKFQTSRMALEQLGLELVLQQGHTPASSWYRDGTGFRGAREIALLGSPDEKGQRV